ncbi:hypothetical protein DVH24_035766 [Malus domestica]|uniref:Uncharacterized protein n=1 Tax=Malus domestica TaxID=3750 RepID=A0A498JMX4_MALDO|nr:hypothetical protein DVH24_035766 [Malus domestica]
MFWRDRRMRLIRSHKAVTTAPRSIHLPLTSATTAPAEMDPMPVNSIDPIDLVGPQVSQASTSSASSVVLLVNTKHGHRCTRTPNTTSIHEIKAGGGIEIA